MTGFASSLIDWSELWQIVVAAFIGGAGVVMVFGLLLLSLQRSTAKNNPGIRLIHRALVAVCGACCIGAVAVGIYAMAEKPSGTGSQPKPAERFNPSHHSGT